MGSRGEQFPRCERMRKQWEFKQVRKYGRAVTGRFLVVSVLRGQNFKHRLIGYIIRKQCGNAVTRNLIKRRLREICRHNQGQIGTDLWMVVIARRDIKQATYSDLEADFLQTYNLAMRKMSCPS